MRKTYFDHVAWIKDYKGFTYTDKLKEKLTKGAFQEASKKTDIPFDLKLQKQTIGFCIDPISMEIEDLGGSSLIFDDKTNKFETNLFTDQFGQILANLIYGNSGASIATVKDDSGTPINSLRNWSGTNSMFMNTAGMLGKLGSGTTAPARSDFKIQTSFGSAPENSYIGISAQGYTGSSAVFNIDASPTGGSGTLNESVTAGDFIATGGGAVIAVLTHEALNGIAFTAGKLLRSAYTINI